MLARSVESGGGTLLARCSAMRPAMLVGVWMAVAVASLAAACGLPAHGLAGGDDDDDDDPAETQSCQFTGCPASAPLCYGLYGETASCVPLVTFSPCTASTDCPGPDAICYGLASGNVQGLCSRPQTYWYQYSDLTSDPFGCGPGAVGGDEDSGTSVIPVTVGDDSVIRSGRVCAPSCDDASPCPHGFACTATGVGQIDAGPALGCVADCESDADCPGVGCNLYTHHCGAVDTSLQDDGQVCQLGSDCRSGWCESPFDGFLDGLCVSKCLAPTARAPLGAALPSAGCPANEVCPPPPPGTGELSQCRPPCTTSADCRPDYVCLLVPGDAGDGGVGAGFCGIRTDPLAP